MKLILDLQSLQTESCNSNRSRYSLSLARAMVSEGEGHEFIVVLNQAFPETLDSIRQSFSDLIPPKNIQVFSVPFDYRPGLASEKQRKSMELIREYFIQQLKPDWVNFSSIFKEVDRSVISIDRFAHIDTAVNIQDFIPYAYSEKYLANPDIKSRYMQQLTSLKDARLLLTPSEYIRNEAMNILGLPGHRIINISADVDACFKSIELNQDTKLRILSRFLVKRDFILYTGEKKYHNNINHLIQAFAELPIDLRSKYHLVICCNAIKEERRRLLEFASRFRLADDEIILTGDISTDELIALYNLCKLYISPSLYEGFGQSVLEAIRCGAPVIGSDSTSLPELVGLKDALFDPTSIFSITERMYQALVDNNFRQKLRDNGKVQSTKFSWKSSAHRAIEAMEIAYNKRQKAKGFSIQTSSGLNKPRLAYISPLPPEQSGIADYSAKLIPELSQYYQIDLITNLKKLANPWLEANLNRRTIAEFQSDAKKYDRVLYHFGNFPFYSHMFSLFEKYPGTVVLHDFYLGDALNYVESKIPESKFFRKALYRSHGYPALKYWQDNGLEKTLRIYPSCLDILTNAQGVIVHSDFARDTAYQFFSITREDLLKKVHLLCSIPELKNRVDSRNALEIPERAFVVCSFGILGQSKKNEILLDAWLNSELGRNDLCYFIFVGDGQGTEFEKSLRERIIEAGVNKRVKITGYVDAKTYHQYLGSADMAVQLRAHSQGETSASVLDCLAYGLATIVNEYGSLSELPSDAVYKLPNEFTISALSNSLEQLFHMPYQRETLGKNAMEYVKNNLNPSLVAYQYAEAIEYFALHHPVALQRRLLTSITSESIKHKPKERELAELARVISENTLHSGEHQLLIDMSVIIHEDFKTGIQRVTRSILQQLLKEPPVGYRIEPVYRVNGFYCYAHRYMENSLFIKDLNLEDTPVTISPGDIFLGLDLDAGIDESSRKWLWHHSQRGLKVYFVIYDLLPLFKPEYFPSEIFPTFKNWVEHISSIADGLVCISKSTADDIGKWLNLHPINRLSPLQIDYFHLGADIESSVPTSGISEDNKALFENMVNRKSILMVSTIEPRKGYGQSLAAFESLWMQGQDVILVIVGKPGWKVEELVKRLRNHPEAGKHLFWLEKASDEMLLRLYQTTSALLMASEGEGFGLPLIEAARHRLPIIARNLPVFTEVAGDHAFYFNGKGEDDLANALKTWLGLYQQGQHPRSEGMSCLTWEESARQMKQIIFNYQWRASWDIKDGLIWKENHIKSIILSSSEGNKC